MLIGGPNQSHKVNFKEPLPRRGKISKKTFRFFFVNTFPEVFRKKFWKERLAYGPFDRPRRFCDAVLTEGTAEHANALWLFKIFLLGFLTKIPY